MVYSYHLESDGRLTITRKGKPAKTETFEYWRSLSDTAPDKAELKATIRAAEAELKQKSKPAGAEKRKVEPPPIKDKVTKEKGEKPARKEPSHDKEKPKEDKEKPKDEKREGKQLRATSASLATNLTGFLTNIKSAESGFKALYAELRDRNTSDAAFQDVGGTLRPGTLFFANAFNLLRQNPAFRAYLENYSDEKYAKLLTASVDQLKGDKGSMELAKGVIRDFFTFKQGQGYVIPNSTQKLASDLKIEMPGNFDGDKMLALAAVMYLRRTNNPTAEVLNERTLPSGPLVRTDKGENKGDEKKPEKEIPVKPPEVIVKPDHPIIFIGVKPDFATDVYAGVLAQKFEIAADTKKLRDEKIKVEHKSLDKISEAQAVIDQAPKGSTVVFVVTARDFFTQSATAPLPEDKRKQFTDAVNELSRKAREKGVDFLVVPALYGVTIGYTEEKRTAVANGNTALQNTLNVTSLLENGRLKSGTAIMAPDPRIGGMPKPSTTQELGRLLAEHFKVAQTQTANPPVQTVKTPENKGGEDFVVPRR